MTIKRYATKRDEKEAPIIEALKAVGAQVEQMDEPCDLLIRFRYRVILLEVEGKSRYRKRGVKQLRFLTEWCVARVHTPAEALYAIGATT